MLSGKAQKHGTQRPLTLFCRCTWDGATRSMAWHAPRAKSSIHDRQDVVLGHDQVVLAVQRDLIAGVGREQHAVSLLDLEWGTLTVVEQFAIAQAQDLALLRLFLGRVRQDNTAGCFFFGLESLDHDLVVERYNFHPLITPWKERQNLFHC